MRCMFCGAPAEEFGPYKLEDLTCYRCAEDPRPAKADLWELIRNVTLAGISTLLVGYVIYCFVVGR